MVSLHHVTFKNTSWRAREVKTLLLNERKVQLITSTFKQIQREKARKQKMRSSKRLYSLLNYSFRRGTDFLGSTRPGQQVGRAACCFRSHDVDGRRFVHSSGPWPNTQPHVLNGDGGATDLYQLTTVEGLKAWFETRKKEIYGMFAFGTGVYELTKIQIV